MESLDFHLPRAEMLCLCRVVSSVADSKFPVAIVGGTLSLINCLNASLDDEITFVPYRPFSFSPVVLITSIQQAHHDVFRITDIVTVNDYLMSRLRTALH